MTDVDAYCRDLEAYLCRKNVGHLIRITGPAFERVVAWAHQGIPLKVAEAGPGEFLCRTGRPVTYWFGVIDGLLKMSTDNAQGQTITYTDRYFERYYRKGPRRRPVRIDFCEADVFDAFDDWRRALGIAAVVPDAAGGPDVEDAVPAIRARRSLASQVEAAVSRLTVLRGSDQAGPVIGTALDVAVRALDALQPEAARARGDARDALLWRVAAIEADLVTSAAAALDAATRADLEREAAAELAPFRTRMAPDAYAQSRRAAIDRLVRLHFGLPEIGV